MTELEREIDRIAEETRFSGVVNVVREDGEIARAYGFADRAHRIPNTVDTVFAIASGTKGFVALVVMSLIEEGRLERSTTARSVLGADLPLIDDAVTIEQLLSHRSGIGDWFDEDIPRPITDHVLTVQAWTLDRMEAFVQALDGYPMKFAPGERFSYNNSAFVVLALIAERVAGRPFLELLDERVCQPAGMTHTSFLRIDELPGEAAIGYLDEGDGLRTNVLHMPVIGGGDGGAYSTVADIASFWRALFEGRIVPKETVAEMTRARVDAPDHEARYGLGFWLHATTEVVELEGYDAGVSFGSVHDPRAGVTFTVISNTSGGAWPIVRYLENAHR